MGNKAKKLLGFVAAATILSSLALTACGKGFHKSEKLDGYVSTETAAVSNGGFAVEKGDYVYFINGVEDYTVENKYGKVEKGALMRIKKTDLASGNYANVDTVVPQLFAAQNFQSGIYIYGDYVYYATPTADKDKDNNVANENLDFKSAKLDGTEAMKGYYFRLSGNTTNYRFVEVGGTVYCMYEEDSALKSYNTKTGATTVLVESASAFFYDQTDLTNPNVYYTMKVSYDLDSDRATETGYNQIYKVNAASTVTVDASKAAYTVNVYNENTNKMDAYKTYDFDESYLKKVNAEEEAAAKKNKKEYEAKYKLNDYTTYPYVNLGTLVLDGMGRQCEVTPYNETDATTKTNAIPEYTLKGFTYKIERHENGGVYYTRKTSEFSDPKLYFYEGGFDAITANKTPNQVAENTTEASSSALFLRQGEEHAYLYIDSTTSKIVRVTTDGAGVETSRVELCSVGSDSTLWKVDGDYLYYYAAGTSLTGKSTSGYQLTRIKYTGDYTSEEKLYDKVYENLVQGSTDPKYDEYKPMTLGYVDFAKSWYMPEMFGDVLMYANAEKIGSSSYNYIYATKLGTASDIKAANEDFKKVYEHIENDFTNSDVKAAMTYYFRTGAQSAIDEVKALFDKELYTEEQYGYFTEFVADSNANTYKSESDFIGLVGKVKDADKESMAQDWTDTLPQENATEEEKESLPVWAICLIVAGGVIIVAAAVVVALILIKKKQAEKAEADATVNAYKRKKIDTTDDKTIDVYADETEETATEETIEEVPAEETEETATEKTAEEVPAEETAAPVEESKAEE